MWSEPVIAAGWLPLILFVVEDPVLVFLGLYDVLSTDRVRIEYGLKCRIVMTDADIV